MSQQINLFNPLFMRKEKYFSTRTMLQSLGLITLGLLAFYVYALYQSRDLESIAAEYSRQLAVQRDQFVALGAQGHSKLLEAEVARLEADVKARRDLLAVIGGGALGNTGGFSRYFAAFARHPMPGVWLTGFSVGDNGNVLNVRGRVLHPDLVPQYLKSLNNDDVMRGRLVTELRLVARDETSAAQGSGGAANGPVRFVEFDLSAPLRLAETGSAAGKGPGR
jgi:hypothetical protein